MSFGRSAGGLGFSPRAAGRWPGRWLALSLLVNVVLMVGMLNTWRQDPVLLRYAVDHGRLPLAIDIKPATAAALPGEMLRVAFRIRNLDNRDVNAIGALEVVPHELANRISVFTTTCGGLQRYPAGSDVQHSVYFRLEPSWGPSPSELTLRQTFTRSAVTPTPGAAPTPTARVAP